MLGTWSSPSIFIGVYCSKIELKSQVINREKIIFNEIEMAELGFHHVVAKRRPFIQYFHSNVC